MALLCQLKEVGLVGDIGMKSTFCERGRIIKNIFRDSLNIDVFDLNYEHCSEKWDHLNVLKGALPKKGFFNRIVAFAYHMFKAIWKGSGVEKVSYFENNVVFSWVTKNQFDSLKPIYKQTTKSKLVNIYTIGKTAVPIFFAFVLSIPYVFLLIQRYRNASPYQKETFRYYMDLYLLTYGYYVILRLVLNKYRPNKIVFSNDHSMPTRVLMLIARQEKITSIYIQHASVTDRFPALGMDYAFLEGQDALNKYLLAGKTKTNIYLVGIAKLDEYVELKNTSPSICSIGLCTAKVESIEEIEKTCMVLRQNFPKLKLIVRLHPAQTDTNGDWKAMADNVGAWYSDSKSEISFDFLNRVDAVIACESNILLEAALLNVFPMCLDFKQNELDWYGFVKTGLVQRYGDINEIIVFLSKINCIKPSVSDAVKLYCHTFSSQYEGRSSELSAELIANLDYRLDGVLAARWERLKQYEAPVFQIRDLS